MNIRQLNSISEATPLWLKSQGARGGDVRVFETPDHKYFIAYPDCNMVTVQSTNLSVIIEQLTEAADIDELTTRYREIFAAPPPLDPIDRMWDVVTWIPTVSQFASELRLARLLLRRIVESEYDKTLVKLNLLGLEKACYRD